MVFGCLPDRRVDCHIHLQHPCQNDHKLRHPYTDIQCQAIYVCASQRPSTGHNIRCFSIRLYRTLPTHRWMSLELKVSGQVGTPLSRRFHSKGYTMPNFSRRILKTFLVLLIPVILILGAVRLLATDAYLAYEYGKPSFPPDTYGFTVQQRFILASTNIHYARAHLPDNELSN